MKTKHEAGVNIAISYLNTLTILHDDEPIPVEEVDAIIDCITFMRNTRKKTINVNILNSIISALSSTLENAIPNTEFKEMTKAYEQAKTTHKELVELKKKLKTYSLLYNKD
jgi:hypothetical protein